MRIATAIISASLRFCLVKYCSSTALTYPYISCSPSSPFLTDSHSALHLSRNPGSLLPSLFLTFHLILYALSVYYQFRNPSGPCAKLHRESGPVYSETDIPLIFLTIILPSMPSLHLLLQYNQHHEPYRPMLDLLLRLGRCMPLRSLALSCFIKCSRPHNRLMGQREQTRITESKSLGVV